MMMNVKFWEKNKTKIGELVDIVCAHNIEEHEHR